MFRKGLPAFTTGLLVLGGCFAAPAHAEKGFWRVGQVPDAPANLAQLAGSILMVEVPSGLDVDIDLIKYSSIDLALTAFEDHAALNEAETILRKRQLARCFSAGIKVCRMHSDFELGTVFMIENTRSFVGAYHVFRDVFRGDRATRIDMILQDAEGRIVFGGDDADHTRLSYAAPEALKPGPTTPQFYDCIRLETSRPIDGRRPLTIAADGSTPAGAMVFIMGYPGATYDRASKLGRPDSNGLGQYVTFGRILARDEGLRRNDKDPRRMDKNVLANMDAAFAISDADSYFGMSGGPMIRPGALFPLSK